MKKSDRVDDFYDIIIKKVQKENVLKKKLSSEKWEVPLYSKKEINDAGRIIANPNVTKEEREQALSVMNNWRASHAYPLQVIASNLRLRNPNAIVVQRLKRLESIAGKIERFPEMQLYRMQDLGGCRVIVDTIDDVYESLNRYKNSRIRHILKRENDYIMNPKESGYRSYHMAYKFQSDKKETYNQNMLIEIQFRTRLQHTWATAVEMMGIYTKSNLKSSQGDEEILRFFVLVSSIYALMEGTPVCPGTVADYDELIKEIKEIDKKNNLISTLSGLRTAINTVNDKIKNNKNGYYILILDYEKNMVRISSFKSNEVEVATNVYSQIEKGVDKTKDVVLVSANSIDTLRAAYPNYFVDISEFIKMLRRILA